MDNAIESFPLEAFQLQHQSWNPRLDSLVTRSGGDVPPTEE